MIHAYRNDAPTTVIEQPCSQDGGFQQLISNRLRQVSQHSNTCKPERTTAALHRQYFGLPSAQNGFDLRGEVHPSTQFTVW